jgi:hypothetical protein
VAATTVVAVTAVALLAGTVATVMTSEQAAAVATASAVAAMAGDSTRVTADEGDGHEREEHRNRETEETLHLKPPDGNPNASCVPEAVTSGNPIRDGYRTAADNRNAGGPPRANALAFRTPLRGCGLRRLSRLGKPGDKANRGWQTVKKPGRNGQEKQSAQVFQPR